MVSETLRIYAHLPPPHAVHTITEPDSDTDLKPFPDLSPLPDLTPLPDFPSIRLLNLIQGPKYHPSFLRSRYQTAVFEPGRQAAGLAILLSEKDTPTPACMCYV